MPLELVVVDEANEDSLRLLHAESNDRDLNERVLPAGAAGPDLTSGRYALGRNVIALQGGHQASSGTLTVSNTSIPTLAELPLPGVAQAWK